jgi:WD40 repeat protein
LLLLVCGVIGAWSQFSDFRNVGRQSNSVITIAYSPDGRTLLSSCTDRKNPEEAGTVWDIAAGSETRHFRGGSRAVLSDGGTWIATYNKVDRQIDIWETATGNKRHSLPEAPEECQRMVFSSFEKMLAVAGDGEVVLWDMSGPTRLHVFPLVEDRVHALAFSPDEKMFACSVFNRVHVWELAQGAEIATFPPDDQEILGSTESIAFSPDNRNLATTFRGNMYIWEIATKKIFVKIPHGSYGPPRCIAFSPDGRFVAVGGAYTQWQYFFRGCLVRVWDVADGKLRSEFQGRIDPHADFVLCLAFAPDSSQLAIGTYEGNVGVVNLGK